MASPGGRIDAGCLLRDAFADGAGSPFPRTRGKVPEERMGVLFTPSPEFTGQPGQLRDHPGTMQGIEWFTLPQKGFPLLPG